MLKNRLKIVLLVVLLGALTLSAQTTKSIGFVVNKDLYPLIKTSLDRYTEDLRKIQQIEVVWVNNSYDATRNQYEQLRGDIKKAYTEKKIDGVIFIGDLPVVDYIHGDETHNFTPQCDLYWMDMDDGTFTGGNKPAEFKRYNGNGPEIWMSRITTSYFESREMVNRSEDEIVNAYFDRVHERMYGGLVDETPSYFIMGAKNHWGTLENENKDDFYYPSVEVYSGSQNTKNTWLKGLNDGHEYFFVYNHSNYNMHQCSPAARINDLISSEGDIRFGNMFACLNSRLDYPNMVAAYGLLNKGLLCVGSGKSGSMIMGTFGAYNKPLNDGALFGEAWVKWWKEKGIGNMSWHSAMVMEGVGTLKLRPYDVVGTNPVAQARPAINIKVEQSFGNTLVYIPVNSSAKVVVTNLLGREVASFNTSKATWYTVPKLQSGLHILRIKTSQGVITKKFNVVK